MVKAPRGYQEAVAGNYPYANSFFSDWLDLNTAIPPLSLPLPVEHVSNAIKGSSVMVLSMDIQSGRQGTGDAVEPLNYAGAARLLAALGTGQ